MYMYLRLVVLCVHVPQFGGIVCTSPGNVVEIDHYGCCSLWSDLG